MAMVCVRGFLHEDAYILFTYSRNLATLGDITFDGVHGPAEGATDFLWMLAIALFQTFRIDVGAGAAILNGCGAALLARSFTRFIPPASSRVAVLTIVPFIVVTPFMSAAAGGFSVLFFAGVYSTALASLVTGRYRALVWQTLLLSLIRPEGVILGAGMLAILLAEAWRDRAVLAHFAVVVLLGLGYFAWRTHYFGEWLPLPLLVKFQGGNLRDGFVKNLSALAPFAAFPVILKRFGSRNDSAVYGKLLLPAALLFAALSFAHQSQNIRFRFQAPIFVSLLMALMVCRIPSRFWSAVAFVPFLVFGAMGLVGEVSYLTSTAYINTFPAELGKELGGASLKVALSEAGRFPYFFKASYLDLVGLNSRDVAVGGLTLEKIAGFAPDFIFVHHAGTYDTAGLGDQRYLMLSREKFLERRFRPPATLPVDPVFRAPVLAAEYVALHPEYDLVCLVRYDGDYSHVYFLNSSRISPEPFTKALDRSFESSTRMSHCRLSKDIPCTFP